MVRLIRLLIWGDWHLCKWQPYGRETDIYTYQHSSRPEYTEQSFQCEHCGKVKVFKV